MLRHNNCQKFSGETLILPLTISDSERGRKCSKHKQIDAAAFRDPGSHCVNMISGYNVLSSTFKAMASVAELERVTISDVYSV